MLKVFATDALATAASENTSKHCGSVTDCIDMLQEVWTIRMGHKVSLSLIKSLYDMIKADETLMLTISASSLPDNVIIGEFDKITIMIVDNDCKSVTSNHHNRAISKKFPDNSSVSVN